MFCSKFAAQAALIYIVFYFSFILLNTIIYELLWPTQFFNKLFVTGLKIDRYRTYVEVNLKSFFNSTFFFNFIKVNYLNSIKI